MVMIKKPMMMMMIIITNDYDASILLFVMLLSYSEFFDEREASLGSHSRLPLTVKHIRTNGTSQLAGHLTLVLHCFFFERLV